MARKTSTAPNITTETPETPLFKPPTRLPTKKSRLIEMLGKGSGSTVAAISQVLGWQPHTSRAAITGLRKAGHHIETTSGDSGTIYRIVTVVPTDAQPAVGEE